MGIVEVLMELERRKQAGIGDIRASNEKSMANALQMLNANASRAQDDRQFQAKLAMEKEKMANDPDAQMNRYLFGDGSGQPQMGGDRSPLSGNILMDRQSNPSGGVVPIESSGGMGIDRDMARRAMIARRIGLPFEYVSTPEEKQGQLDQKIKETEALQESKMRVPPNKLKEDLQKAELASQNLQYMKEKALNLPSGYGALFSNFGNFLGRGGLNSELALYEKQMPAMAVAIYREITGDTRLSDDDAKKRAYPLLWNPSKGENEAIKVGTFNDLEKLYQARTNLIRKGAYRPNPKDTSEMITPIEDVMAEAGIGSSTEGSSQEDVKARYNALRKNGVSAVDAKKQLGL